LLFKIDFCKFSSIIVTILSQRSLAVSTLNVPVPLTEYTRSGLIDKVAALFRTTFDSAPTAIASAPGRVNLIGEHTDYNNGFVLPAAINRTTAVAAGPRNDDSLFVYSFNLRSLVKMDMKELRPSKENAWANYPAGVAWFLREAGAAITGANIAIAGNIPQGAGLSSSAALELGCAQALVSVSGFSLPPIAMAKICRRAENEFAGVSCGIMDQFVSAVGRAHHALFLDCQSLDHEYIPLPGHVRIIVCDTGVERTLASSGYNKRRQECLFAVKQLSEMYSGLTSLREVSLAQLEESRGALDPVIWKRAHHVVTENERVRNSATALKQGDLQRFGTLMYDSHTSLQNDYDVSCPELDAVVDICRSTDGVFGARMTGAGFGGAAICLVDEKKVDAVRTHLKREYQLRTGRNATIHVCTIDNGVTLHMS
jgi:galactokinase